MTDAYGCPRFEECRVLRVQGCLGISNSPAFLRGTCRRFLFVLWTDADLFQEWLNRLFAAEELLDGNRNVSRFAGLVNFAAQFHTGLFVKVTGLRFFEYGRHIGGDRIRPSIAIVTGIVAVQMPEVGNERGAWIDWQKYFFQNWIRHCHAIVRRIFGMLIVQRQIKRSEGELASVKNAGVK